MKYRGLFIGLTTIDIKYFTKHFPPANTKVKTTPPEIWVGGPATNAAVAFSKLNNGAFLVSASGNNSFSEFISNDLIKTNVTHFDIVNEQATKPVIASVITTKNGDRTIFTHHPEMLNPSAAPIELFDRIHPEIVLIDGFYPEFSIECAKIAKQRNIPLVLDCGSWKPQYKKLLKYADIVICSSEFYPPGCENSQQVFDYLKNKSIHKIAISRGGENVLFHNKLDGEISIKKTKTIDTLGAGDFLHGAFCFYYLNLCQFELALKKATELASFTCRFKGTRDWINITALKE